MMMARPNVAAVCGTTEASPAPSRTCKCQSSGRVMVRLSGCAAAADATARRCRRPAAPFLLLALRSARHAMGPSIVDGAAAGRMPGVVHSMRAY